MMTNDAPIAPIALLARKVLMATIVDAEPEAIAINPERTAVVVIDMQRDFLEPGGFGESLVRERKGEVIRDPSRKVHVVFAEGLGRA